MLTGDSSVPNALTIVQSTVTFGDGVLAGLDPNAPAAEPVALPLAIQATVVGIGLILVHVRPLRNLLLPTQMGNTAFDPRTSSTPTARSDRFARPRGLSLMVGL